MHAECWDLQLWRVRLEAGLAWPSRASDCRVVAGPLQEGDFCVFSSVAGCVNIVLTRCCLSTQGGSTECRCRGGG